MHRSFVQDTSPKYITFRMREWYLCHVHDCIISVWPFLVPSFQQEEIIKLNFEGGKMTINKE